MSEHNYMLLNEGDPISSGDEFWSYGRWYPQPPELVGQRLKGFGRRRITPPPSSSPWRRIADGGVTYPALLLNIKAADTCIFFNRPMEMEHQFSHWMPYQAPEPDIPAEELALRNAIKEYCADFGTGCQHGFESGWKAHAEFARREKE
jgi:hypothetical protein